MKVDQIKLLTSLARTIKSEKRDKKSVHGKSYQTGCYLPIALDEETPW